jgi:NAD+ diphosphatase
MLGFTADYDYGEIEVDGEEIIDAKWFKPEEIEIPLSDISISSWLIQNFIETMMGDK